ncbi:MAG: D-alanine--D-alanine ligase [Planctomycetota bacterium]
MSLRSGRAVADACRRNGHEVFEADISPSDLQSLAVPADIIFPMLHGEFGEDGELQTILEQSGISFVGSGSAASRMGMDKNLSKTRWKLVGLPTSPWQLVDSESDLMNLKLIEPPFVMKPNAGGSSIDVECAGTLTELNSMLAEKGERLVEHRLSGPDISVAILSGETLPVLRIESNAEFLNYEAKYQRSDTNFVFDPESRAPYVRNAQDLAMQAFEAIGARDYARVDFVLDSQLGLQLLEINTVPGMTATSQFPAAAKKAGIGFDEMIEILVKLAAERKGEN